MQDVIDKYFKDRNTLFFHGSDALNQIEGNTYLRYVKDGSIQLWFGGSNGEVCILCTRSPEKLEEVIKAIIY